MKFEFKDDTLFLTGFLDESTNFDELKEALEKGQSVVNESYLKVNFSDVSMANSVGILKWLKSIENLKVKLCYSQAPKWLVSQLNMIPQFMKNKAVVESFEVPFYCENNDRELVVLFVVGKDIQIKSELYNDEDFIAIEDDGDTYVIDVLPKNYFRFISDNAEAFNEYLKAV
ncbi:MAG: hypothetical protein KDD58_12660 [Bdellovibrionales bacterium]|nr:hypothetical protein [Bdellovibrionales bacterium]